MKSLINPVFLILPFSRGYIFRRALVLALALPVLLGLAFMITNTVPWLDFLFPPLDTLPLLVLGLLVTVMGHCSLDTYLFGDQGVPLLDFAPASPPYCLLSVTMTVLYLVGYFGLCYFASWVVEKVRAKQ